MSKFKITLIAVAVILLAIRIALPEIIKAQLNKVLSELPEYQGSVEDVDLVLYKGGFAVDGFRLEKINALDSIPFINVGRAELKVDLKALIHGHIMMDVDLIQPQVNFVAAEDTSQQQYGGDYLWFESLLELQPLEINELVIKEGEIHFKKVDSEPEIDLSISKLEATAKNLRNVVAREDKLPSNLQLTAEVFDKGALSIDVDMNILKEVPDLNLNLKMEHVDIQEMNNFLLTYVNMDAAEGELNVYSEVAVSDSKIDGYIKPLINNLHFSSKDEDIKFKQKVFETLSDLAVNLIKNQDKDQIASKVPIEGTVEDTEIGIVRTLMSVLANGFIEALKGKLDHTIDYPVIENK